jgi:hypothetical protein
VLTEHPERNAVVAVRFFAIDSVRRVNPTDQLPRDSFVLERIRQPEMLPREDVLVVALGFPRENREVTEELQMAAVEILATPEVELVTELDEKFAVGISQRVGVLDSVAECLDTPARIAMKYPNVDTAL